MVERSLFSIMPGSLSRNSRRVRVNFALNHNTEQLILKTKEEKIATWYNEEEKTKFKKNALRDAQFFRHIREKNPDADLSLYDNRICSWGLEKSISEKTALKTMELKRRVVKAVLSIQTIQGSHSKLVDNPYAIVTKRMNEYSAEVAQKFGAFRAKRIRELFPEFEKFRKLYVGKINKTAPCKIPSILRMGQAHNRVCY